MVTVTGRGPHPTYTFLIVSSSLYVPFLGGGGVLNITILQLKMMMCSSTWLFFGWFLYRQTFHYTQHLHIFIFSDRPLKMHSLKLTASLPLKDGWKTSSLLPFGSNGLFLGANLLLVLGSVIHGWISTEKLQYIFCCKHFGRLVRNLEVCLVKVCCLSLLQKPRFQKSTAHQKKHKHGRFK